VRRWNLRGWSAYREACLAGRLPVEDEETVEGGDAALERVWLGLRTDLGYPLHGAPGAQRRLAAEWERHGWAREDGGALRLTAEGWLLLDRLAVELAGAGD
jgi:coproporphyrinogen III oxidase-like Fe-S oxidoreductase